MASMIPSSVIDLRDLRLEDARALVAHDPANRLSELEGSPTQLLQSILDGLCELSLKDPLTGLA
ncbi:MAG: GGDEF domain-containing protein, partial [Rhodoferax sp.]